MTKLTQTDDRQVEVYVDFIRDETNTTPTDTEIDGQAD